ncbi:hypothetical protein [Macrococcus equipercicus]|uniref:DUF2513 domain-containing protein n=1 Tax=Macrococcus equipercicus TaxID=69967 RepID=A0A9Q9F1H3_9STAP|nr:hypothetical protein [Macrococcus equipercicus]KAA1039602.1 hypothetical protein ERX35_005880 [Macrococcus equipercicus]UTH13932.1 hypothetical protein KFV11_00735 [Macrococcus equipercicus]
MELNRELLIFILQTINLHQSNQLSLEQLKTLTVNQFSNVSEELFISHFNHLSDKCYLTYHNTLEGNDRYIYDLGLTFYGATALRQHISNRQFK